MSIALLGPFCALMSSVTWAFGTAGYSRLAREHSPYSVNLARSTVALPLFLLATAVFAVLGSGSLGGVLRAFDSVRSGNVFWLTVSIFSSYALGDSLFLLSSREIGVPAALTIASSYPLLTAGWAALVEGEPLRHSQLAGLIITVAAVVAVIQTASAPKLIREGARGGNKLQGVLLAVGSCLCWALNSYAVGRGGQGVSIVVGNTIRMAAAIVLCIIAAKLLAPRTPVFLPRREYRKWLWLFVLEGFGGSCLFLYGLAHSSLVVGPTLASVAPVLSVPVSLALGVEIFSWKRTASVFAVVFGICLLMYTP